MGWGSATSNFTDRDEPEKLGQPCLSAVTPGQSHRPPVILIKDMDSVTAETCTLFQALTHSLGIHKECGKGRGERALREGRAMTWRSDSPDQTVHTQGRAAQGLSWVGLVWFVGGEGLLPSVLQAPFFRNCLPKMPCAPTKYQTALQRAC